VEAATQLHKIPQRALRLIMSSPLRPREAAGPVEATAAPERPEAAALLRKHGGQQVIHVRAPVAEAALLAALLYFFVCPSCTT
jgi:hypothetical protein